MSFSNKTQKQIKLFQFATYSENFNYINICRKDTSHPHLCIHPVLHCFLTHYLETTHLKLLVSFESFRIQAKTKIIRKETSKHVLFLDMKIVASAVNQK